MTSPAGGDEYSTAVQRLQAYIEQLSNLAEERLGLQQASARQPEVLYNLWNAISETLGELRAVVTDEKVKDAIRLRQLAFDEIVDPIYQHMQADYEDKTLLFDAWGKYRHRLRAELDILGSWSSGLIIATSALIGHMREATVFTGLPGGSCGPRPDDNHRRGERSEVS